MLCWTYVLVDLKEGLDLLTPPKIAKVDPKPIPIHEEHIQMVELEKLVHPIKMPVNMVSINCNHDPEFDIEYAMSVFKSEKKLIYPKVAEDLFEFLLW